MESPLYRLVYASTFNVGRIDHAPSALRSILSASKRNNASAGITGFLVFDGETFLQVLEGRKDDIAATFSRIEGDDRHRNIEILGWQPAADRSFEHWAMESYLRTPQQDHIFRKHGIDGKVRRAALKGVEILALAIDLSRWKSARQAADGQ